MLQSCLRVVTCGFLACLAHTSEVGLLRRQEKEIAEHSQLDAAQWARSGDAMELFSKGHVRMHGHRRAHSDTRFAALYDQLDHVWASVDQGVSAVGPEIGLDLIERFGKHVNRLKTVCGTGLSTGHSAVDFLAHTKAKVYLFDSGENVPVKTVSTLLRQNFPKRMSSIWGDSKSTLQEFTSQHPDVQCDLMMIDGGHYNPAATDDLHNFAKLASAQHLLALSKGPCDSEHCQGAAQEWQELVKSKCIEESGVVRAGEDTHLTVGHYVPCSLWPQIGSKGYDFAFLEMGKNKQQSHMLSDHRKQVDSHLLASFGIDESKEELQGLYSQLDEAVARARQAVDEDMEGHTDNVGTLKYQTDKYDSWARSETGFNGGPLHTVCETGFNAGHSALRFLAQSNARLYEFDLGVHDYAKSAAGFLEDKFPDRLNITWGDSMETLPQIHSQHPELKCDLVIVDGGHDQKNAESDLKNFAKMVAKDHVLAIDDTPCSADYCAGPTGAWNSLVRQGCIKEVRRFAMTMERGFSTGHYTPCPLWPQVGKA